MSDASARAAAFSLGEKLTVPVRTRTLAVAEFRRQERRLLRLGFGIYGVFTGLILFGLAVDGESGHMLSSMVPFSILGGLILAFGARWRLRKHAGYRDHRVAIEVTGGGVRIDWDGQSYALDYEDVRFRLYWQTIKGNTQFLGIRLETPIGPLDLVDQWYQGGCHAAAAIVTEHDKWHHLRRLA